VAAPTASSRLPGHRAPFYSLDALFEPFESGESNCCNAADHRGLGHNRHGILQQHRPTDQQSRDAAKGHKCVLVPMHDLSFAGIG
jgi:hypothetical protein